MIATSQPSSSSSPTNYAARDIVRASAPTMTKAEMRAWATRVVDMYAESVTMTLAEQGELERAVVARFTEEASDGPVSSWIDPANSALSAWEAGHPQRGARVSGISVGAKQVIGKPRRLW